MSSLTKKRRMPDKEERKMRAIMGAAATRAADDPRDARIAELESAMAEIRGVAAIRAGRSPEMLAAQLAQIWVLSGNAPKRLS